LSARDVLAPQHHLWLLWVAAAGALAAKVTNSSLLLLVCAKRKAMAAALRPEDVYLAIQFAVAVGFGSDAATESLLSAFHIDQSLGEESGAVDFIERWMPEGPMWGPRVRTAAGVALGLTVRPPNLLVPSDLQFNGRMRSLAEQRSAMTKEHTLKLAVAAIREWEQSRDDERDDEEEEMTHVFARARPQDLERVWRIEQAFDGDECDRIMAAVDAAADARGWDKDRHGKYPTTDMPMTAIGEMESEIRQMLFSRVLRPLAPLYLPEPFLPEHLQFIDLFFVKYSAAEGQQRGLTTHTDDSTFSFNILLNAADAFEGGGTLFEQSGQVVKPPRGCAVVHSGHARHGGLPITRGERYLLVGFVGSVTYPYTAQSEGAAEHAEANAFTKFGADAWDRSPLRTTATLVPRPSVSPPASAAPAVAVAIA